MKKSYAHIDLIFSFGIIFLIIFFFLNFDERVQRNFLESKNNFRLNLDAVDICNYLINGKGKPVNWTDLNLASKIGFESENSFDLSFTKISSCNKTNLLKIREKLNINSYISFSLFNVTNSNVEIFSCRNIPKNYFSYANHLCYSKIGKDIVKFEVELWE